MLKLSEETTALLEDIEKRIDPETENDYFMQWKDFLENRFKGDVFTPVRKKTSKAGVPYRNININDAIGDYELMLVSQMEGVSRALERPSGTLDVRSNYGTGIMTSVLGAKIFVMPYEQNTLPTTYPAGSVDEIKKIIDKGVPSPLEGWGKNVFEMGEIFKEVFEKYPKISEYVSVYHPDAQGPLDICELLWGSDIFYSMYDEPELIHGMLRLSTDLYIKFMEKWFELFPNKRDINSHWGSFMYKGYIVLRDDSAMNISSDFYEEFALPYDAELLDHFGGGAIHFCGRGDHYIEVMSGIKGLTGINMSQPHLNDMEKIYQNTVDKNIKLLGFNRKAAEKNVTRSGVFHGNMHC